MQRGNYLQVMCILHTGVKGKEYDVRAWVSSFYCLYISRTGRTRHRATAWVEQFHWVGWLRIQI